MAMKAYGIDGKKFVCCKILRNGCIHSHRPRRIGAIIGERALKKRARQSAYKQINEFND
jgi:hypothetical protein